MRPKRYHRYLENAPQASNGNSALEVYKKYKDKVPFPIIDFAEEFGLKVYTQLLPLNQSGRFDKQTKEIIINRDEPPTRHRFTIAHELAHFLLNHEAGGKIPSTAKMVAGIHLRKLSKNERPTS